VIDFSPARAWRFVLILGAAGTALTLGLGGLREAIAFVIGSALSALSLYSWVRVTDAVAATGKQPPLTSAVFLALRFLIIGVALYVIVNFLGIPAVPMIVGLLVSFAAVVVELLYNLWKSTS
jgi:hypothetical protein